MIIEKSRLRFQFRGLWSLFRSDQELPISEFKAVEIAGKVVDELDQSAEIGVERVYISVKLLHGSNPRKNVLLAKEGFDYSDVTEEEVEPLRKLWADAARTLSLLAADAGWRIQGSIGDKSELIQLRLSDRPPFKPPWKP